MMDFIRFMAFRYWNDFDAKSAGYRVYVLFAWTFMIVALASAYNAYCIIRRLL
jgi:hypothetical protein